MTDIVHTVAQETHHEIKIERSRFIGHCVSATSEEEAREFIAKIRVEYADATHNCYAYRVGPPLDPVTYYHDHGEPTGTAGKPILNAILQADLHQTTVVVTRYFGGKKLGVRGLIDAYHQTAAELLELAGRQAWVEGSEYFFTVSYRLWPILQYQAESHEAKIVQCDYAESVQCKIWIPKSHQDEFLMSLSAYPDLLPHKLK
jgi:uncharacterized YigZ family protein